MKSIHELTVRRFIAHGLPFETKGFKKAILTAYGEILSDFVADRRWPVPDAYMVNADEQKVIIIEVEDTSKLSCEKLTFYMGLWAALDCFSVDVQLDLYDRYGNPVDCNMQEFYMQHLKDKVAETNAD